MMFGGNSLSLSLGYPDASTIFQRVWVPETTSAFIVAIKNLCGEAWA